MSDLTINGLTTISQLSAPCNTALILQGANQPPVIRIMVDGQIFWHGREVVGDDDFKACMVEMCRLLREAK